MIYQQIIQGSLAPAYSIIDILEEDNLEQIVKLFNQQKKRKLHLCDFADDEWHTGGDGDYHLLDFGQVKHWPCGISRKKYINALKSAYVIWAERWRQPSPLNAIKFIMKLTNQTEGFRQGYEVRIDCFLADRIKEFLDEVDVDDEEIMNALLVDDQIKKKKKQRELAFDAWIYYVFDYELNQFWEVASEEEKLIYAPLYFFWNICVVIPTRPRAFTYLQYDCIEKDEEGIYYIYLPQSICKGSSQSASKKLPRNTTYDDYPKIRRSISEKIACELIWYREKVKDTIDMSDCNDIRLFNNVIYNQISNKNLKKDLKIRHLQKRIEQFIFEILVKEKKYIFMEVEGNYIDTSRTKAKWIGRWRPGDLRHIAMIDLISAGVDPAIIMDLAGHTDISTACHYYTNVAPVIKTRLQFLKGKNCEERSMTSHGRFTQISQPAYLVDGGICIYGDMTMEERKEICCRYQDHYGCPGYICKTSAKVFEDKYNEEISSLMNIFLEAEKKGLKQEAIVALQKAKSKIKQLEQLEEQYARTEEKVF